MTIFRNDHAPIPSPGPEPAPRQLPELPDKLKDQEAGFVLNFLKLSEGIWTPWAQVLCADCMRPTPRFIGDLEKIGRPREIRDEDWELQGWCDECGKEVWIDNKIACEQRMVRALKKHGIPARMEQTGGMCSAAEVWSPDDKMYMMITPDEASMTIDGDHWCVGVYDSDGEWLENKGVEDVSFALAVARVRRIYYERSNK